MSKVKDMKKLIIILAITIPLIVLTKYITKELVYYLTANDDVDLPDFNEMDHKHLNGVLKWKMKWTNRL